MNADLPFLKDQVVDNSYPSLPAYVAVAEYPTTMAACEGSQMGVNLAGIADWSSENPFLDVMKTARSWIGHLPGQWGGWDHVMLADQGYLDRNGWPMRIPKELTGITTLVLTDQPTAQQSVGGRYRLSYKGEGSIDISGRGKLTRQRPGEIWFEFSPGEGSVILTIQSTDPHGVGNYLRDIKIVAERSITAFEAGKVFNSTWVARLQNLEVVRFMDWMATNGSTATSWSARPRTNDYTYALKGVPIEVLVALANSTGIDPWFTMPHAADDDYYQAFAETVRASLQPERRVYVEYSNEVWNWQFEQASWLKSQAELRWGTSVPGDAWMQFAGGRAAEMAQIWNEAFEGEADRLIPVIATQTAWRGLETPLLEAPLWVAENPRRQAPASFFEAYAVSGYFGSDLGSDLKAPMVQGWLAQAKEEANPPTSGAQGTLAQSSKAKNHLYGEALALAAAELLDGSISGEAADSLRYLLGTLLPYHATVANDYSLDLVMYEGGTHVVGVGSWAQDEELTSFFVELNYSQPISALYRLLLDGWEAVGGTLFTAYADVGMPGRWGSWGLLRHLDDDNPRWNAFAERVIYDRNCSL